MSKSAMCLAILALVVAITRAQSTTTQALCWGADLSPCLETHFEGHLFSKDAKCVAAVTTFVLNSLTDSVRLDQQAICSCLNSTALSSGFAEFINNTAYTQATINKVVEEVIFRNPSPIPSFNCTL